MKTKFLFGILLTTILLTMAVSASVSFTLSPDTTTFTQALNSAEITVTNTGNETATFTIPSGIKMSDGTNTVAISFSKYTFSIPSGGSEKISATINPLGHFLKYLKK